MEKKVALFLAELQRLGRSPQTISGYEIDINQFIKYSGSGLSVSNFNAAVTKFFVSGPQGAPNTQKRRYAAVKALAKFMKIQIDEVELPKPPRRLPKSLRVHDIEKLFLLLRKDKESPHYLRDLAMFELLYCGLRNSELRRITRDSVDYAGHSLRVIGKGNKEMVYNLSDGAVDALKNYAMSSRGNKTLFDMSADHLINIIVKRAQKYIGKHVTPHTLRHSMAMHVLLAGADIRLVQKMLNHASISTTQVYTEAYDDTVADAFRLCHPHN